MRRVPLESRFWSKVDKRDQDECWEWKACVGTNGYGRIMVDGKCDYAHRLAVKLTYGEIGEAMVVDHLCESKTCCNPAHLDVVTNSQNAVRSRW